MRFRYQIEIDCPPDRVWPWLEEPERQKEWMHGLVSNEPTNEKRNEVGATFLMKIKEGRRETDYEGEVTKYDRPRLLGVKLVGSCGKGPPMEMNVEYGLTDLGRKTRLDYEAEWVARGFMMRLFAPLFVVMGKLLIKRFFKTLKSLAEKEPAPVAS